MVGLLTFSGSRCLRMECCYCICRLSSLLIFPFSKLLHALACSSALRVIRSTIRANKGMSLAGRRSWNVNGCEIDVEPLGDYLEEPALAPDAMAHSAPFVAKEEHQAPLGFPGELVPDWRDKAINKMGELLSKYRSLPVF